MNRITDFSEISEGQNYLAELQAWSPLGEDLVEEIAFNGTLKGFVDGFDRVFKNYDPDEHAAELIANRGKDGIPESVMDLAEDATKIGEMYV